MLSSWLTVATSRHFHACLCGPTRNVTDEAMPTSFDVPITQPSFLEFVQRCNNNSQTLLCRPPHHVKFFRILPPRRRTNLVAVQTTSRSTSSSFLDAAVQTPSYSPLSQDVSTQFGSRTVSSFLVDAVLQTSFCHLVQG